MTSALAIVAACAGPPPAPAAVSLTHQWAVKAGTSLFVQASLGTSPDSAADGLMGAMPTLVHALGEKCRDDPAAKKPGVFVVTFTLGGASAPMPTADPPSPLADCVVAALPAVLDESAAELEVKAPTGVVLHLEHAPVSG